MGNQDSKIKSRVKYKNQQKNKNKSPSHSQQEAEDQKPQKKQAFQSLDEKHRQILNFAIASALKRIESQQQVKAEQQQKKIISSLNRYYQQNKNVIPSVDAQNMTETDYETIIRTLRKHHFFNQLLGMMNVQKDFVTMFLFSIKKKTFKFKQYIYKQFDPSSYFYIIAEGKLFVQLNSMGLKPLSKTDYFGLQSIIYDCQQSESVKVKSSTAILYEISKQQIMKVHKKINIKSKDQIHQLLQDKVIFFNFLDHKEKKRVLERTVKSTYSKGEIIFEKDYDSNAFFVIKKGNVLIKIPQKKDLILEAGSSFGQSSFNLNKLQRQGKAVAYEDNTIIYGIGSRTILKSLGNKLDCAVLQNSEKWALYRDIQINQLYFTYKFNMEKLLSKFKLKRCDKYQVLGRKGEQASKIFLNVRCEINFTKQMTVFNSKFVKKLVKQYEHLKQKQNRQSIQESNSLNQQGQNVSKEQDNESFKNFVYNQDIIVTEKGNYSEANLEEVVQLMIQAIEQPEKHQNQKFRVDLSVGNVQKYAKLSTKNGMTTILGVQKNFNMEIIVKIYHKINKNDIFFTENSFHTLSSKYYKSSSSILQSEVMKKMMNQKQIIQRLDHPNFCGFYKIEENQNNYYLLLQYIKGVTLNEVQQELGIMPEILIKFYTLSLSFMLDYLHQKEVIYRNLMLQKILIDNNGFPNLFDFKKSKKVNEVDNYRTSTIIETPHYCSPEAIQRKSYSFQIDFWQLGVVLYQLIYKKLPFGQDSQNPMEVYTQILKKQPNLKKINSQSAVSGLLQKDPSNRVKNFKSLTKQSYFENFDWQTIQQQKMIPPYVPKNPTRRFKNAQVCFKKQKY